MQSLVSALKGPGLRKLPQIGLRLVNKLQEGHTSDKFWLEYIDCVRNPENFRKLSPHSKCLLTCVVTKFDRGLVKRSKSDELLSSIYADVVNAKCLPLLNLELINMVMVSSYTLRVPLSTHQLDLILNRINETSSDLFKRLSEQEESNEYCKYRLGVEDSVSVLHSLASLARHFPASSARISHSAAVRTFTDNLDLLLDRINCREFSLVLFAFDKLRLINDQIAEGFYRYAALTLDRFHSQSLTTAFYFSALNPKLGPLFNSLKTRINGIILSSLDSEHDGCPRGVGSVTAEDIKFTGRESCNILCSLIKARCFEDYHDRFLMSRMTDMNLQELCNVTSLLVSVKHAVDDAFKRAFVNKLMCSDLDNMALLDALTVANCFYNWGIENDVILARVVTAISTNSNFRFGEKAVLFLHYLVQLGHYNLKGLPSLFLQNFNSSLVSTPQLIILYNSVNNIRTHLNTLAHENAVPPSGAESQKECSYPSSIEDLSTRIEDEINKLDLRKLTKIDLMTLARSPTKGVVLKLIEYLELDPSRNFDVCLAILKSTGDPEVVTRIKTMLGTIDIDQLFIETLRQTHLSDPKRARSTNGVENRLSNLLVITLFLRDNYLIGKIVALASTQHFGDFGLWLSIATTCRKLLFVDQHTPLVIKQLVAYFVKTCLNKADNGLKTLLGIPDVSDFLGVLYHLDNFRQSDAPEWVLEKALESLTTQWAHNGHSNNLITHQNNNLSYPIGGSFSGKGANNPVDRRTVPPYTHTDVFESLLFSLSALCFSAVFNSALVSKFLSFYLNSLAGSSPRIFKCLAMNPSCVNHLTLKELEMLPRPVFPDNFRHSDQENEVHLSVFSTLRALGLRPGAEDQVLDYRIDILLPPPYNGS